MEKRQLGRSGLTTIPLALGTVTFGREIDEDSAYRILDYAVERGITFIDTAEAYGGGQAHDTHPDITHTPGDGYEVTQEMSSSEAVIGRWLKSRGVRDQLTLCTKVSFGGASPENIASKLEESLDRLNTDHVDVYKLHSPDHDTPVDETLDALTGHVSDGRIGTIGASNHTADDLQQALDASARGEYARYEVIQPQYNLAHQPGIDDILDLCLREEMAVTSHMPLGAGFFTGKYVNDMSRLPKATRFFIMPGHATLYFTEKNFEILAKLQAKAAELKVPMTRLAMAWVMTHPAITAPLVGARERAHIDNAFAAYEMGLDPELREEMTSWTG